MSHLEAKFLWNQKGCLLPKCNDGTGIGQISLFQKEIMGRKTRVTGSKQVQNLIRPSPCLRIIFFRLILCPPGTLGVTVTPTVLVGSLAHSAMLGSNSTLKPR